MKRLLFLFSLLSGNIFSQEIQGDWYGNIDIMGTKLGFVLHISKTDSTFKSFLDIPEQNAKGISMTTTTFTENELLISSKELAGEFKGKWIDDTVSGLFSQNGGIYPFEMSREIRAPKVIRRPQEPKPKFKYKIEEVSFENKSDKVKLSGTLTLPKGRGPFPAVVLVSGSGPQDRNCEILGHKSFWVIADYLTRNGIAVLRYDDRGVSKSSGNFSSGTTEDFARDAAAAVNFLNGTGKINKAKIGLIGHSEGGTIAPIVASNQENSVGFIILLAGTAISGAEILLLQQQLISKVQGEKEDIINENTAMSEALFQFMKENIESKNFNQEMQLFLENYMVDNDIQLPEGINKEQIIKLLVSSYATPWMKNFLFYDPKDAFLNTKCPVLALNGSNDLQVTPKENLSVFKKLAEQSGNENVTTIELPGLNHLFQHSETGAPVEYGSIEETFAPEVLEIMKNWIKKLP